MHHKRAGAIGFLMAALVLVLLATACDKPKDSDTKPPGPTPGEQAPPRVAGDPPESIESDTGSGGEATGGDKGLGEVGANGIELEPDILDPAFRHGYDREAVRRVVRANVGQIQWCHRKELQRDPAYAGTVVVSFLIGADGLHMQIPVEPCV